MVDSCLAARYYTVLYSIHPLITTELGPIFILITFNIFIYKRVAKAKRRYVGRGEAFDGNAKRICMHFSNRKGLEGERALGDITKVICKMSHKWHIYLCLQAGV